MAIVIRVENLGKQYLLSHQAQQGSYLALRDVLADGAKGLGRRLLGRSAPTGERTNREEFWALRDVSFEVRQGERLGIIGRNGAGKSTLLKILSRITEPSTGEVRIKGRVASLLEVGTGFHPELTGRENIFLNGAILGMGRSEIRKKFDEIVHFAEIERFLDTPVKRYSSGMYVRLAFAVAAHLEPEILVVDEVLAVGDAQFQKKCLGKMEDVSSREGRTVLFISHNMAAIRDLCRTGVLLDSGTVRHTGPIGETIHAYSELLNAGPATLRSGGEGTYVVGFSVSGPQSGGCHPDAPLQVEVALYSSLLLPDCYLNLVVEDADGRAVIHSRTDRYGALPTLAPGLHKIGIHLPRLSLRSGVYTVWFRLYSGSGSGCHIVDSDRVMLEVEGPQVGGVVDVPCCWTLDEAVVGGGGGNAG